MNSWNCSSRIEVPEDLIHKVCKEATQSYRITPVFCGSAYKNKGVQLLLDAVTRYLPSPLEREIKARKVGNEAEKVELKPNNDLPFVGMAFKIVEDPFGQLTFMRVYQGKAVKGEMYINQRTSKRNDSVESFECTLINVRNRFRRSR